MATVRGLVGHDPADGEARERRPDCERRHRRSHQEIEGDETLGFDEETLLQDT